MAGVRRTWDKEAYAAKARERLEKGDEDEIDLSSSNPKKRPLKEEFVPAEEGAEGPMGSERAFIKARKGPIDLDSKVGKVQVVNPTTVEGSSAPGFWCDVCSCLLKDSASYLDHINGKKHQRALGYSMRVERANTDQVKDRISLLKQKINDQKSATVVPAVDDYDARLAAQTLEVERMKRQKKEEAAARKKEQEEAQLEEMDPEIAALMGFGGFGGSKKN